MHDTVPGGAEHRLPIRFVGSGSEYFRIWIVNLLLTLLTIGLYYPFAKARKLRYFYGATEVGGHPLAFHADPWKMLRGYILVAVMIGLYSVAGEFSPLAGLIAFVIVASIWPALWHSSLVFRLVNTGWRGLRFRFAGSRGQAYRVLLPALVAAFVVIALGGVVAPEPGEKPSRLFWIVTVSPLALIVAMPWLLWRMRRYQHDHYGLGAEQTGFSAGVGGFYRVFGVAALIGGLMIGAVAATVFGMMQASFASGRSPGAAAIFSLTALILVFYVLLFSVVGAYLGARLQNLVWNATRSRRIGFESRLSVRSFLMLSLKNAVLIVLTLGLYLPFAAIASARLRLEAVEVVTDVDPDHFAAVAARYDEAAAGDAAGDLFGFDIGL